MQQTFTQTFSYGFSSGFGGPYATACGTNYFCSLANIIINTINGVLVPLLFAIAFIVFLYGIAKAYIFSGGEPDKVSEGHKLILWGLVAFAVMISVWGLVNIVAYSFGLNGSYAPPTPTSYSGQSVPGTYGGQPPGYLECPKKPDGSCI